MYTLQETPGRGLCLQRMDSQNPQGLCLVCAKELGIKPVNDIMEKMGITDEELEAATEQMTQLMNLDNDDSGDELFAPGGAATLPVDQMLGGRPGKTAALAAPGSSRKRRASTRRSASTSRTSAPI